MYKKSLNILVAFLSLVCFINFGQYRVSADDVEPDAFSGVFRTDVYAGSGLSSTGLKYSNDSYNLPLNPIENHSFIFTYTNNDLEPVARNFSVNNSRNYNIAFTSFDFHLGFKSDKVPDPDGFVYLTLPFYVTDHNLNGVSTENSFYYANVYDPSTDTYSSSLGSISVSTILLGGYHAIVLKIPFSEFSFLNDQYVFSQDSDLDLFITGRFSSVKNENFYYFLNRLDTQVRFDEKPEITPIDPPDDPPDDSDTNSLISSLISSVTGGFSNVLIGLTGLSDDISDLGEYIVSNVGSFFDTAGQIFQTAGDLILGGLTSLGNSIIDFLRDPLGSISGLLQSIFSYFGSFWNNLSGLLNSLMSGIVGMINELGNAIGNLGNLLIGDPVELFDTLTDEGLFLSFDARIIYVKVLNLFVYDNSDLILTIPAFQEPISGAVLWQAQTINITSNVAQLGSLKTFMNVIFSFLISSSVVVYYINISRRIRALLSGDTRMEVD